MRTGFAVAAAVVAAAMGTSAMAAKVADGTVSSVALFNPAVTLGTSQSTYSAMNGTTFEVSGTGGFTSVAGGLGRLNGSLTFSDTVNTTKSVNLANFFTFSDGKGGNYNYSVSSVLTKAFVNDKTSASGTLYLLGNVVDSVGGMTTPTLASLSLQFNRTGGSAFSSALTLDVPPASAVPEPASWALMICGAGFAGGMMRRRNGKLLAAA